MECVHSTCSYAAKVSSSWYTILHAQWNEHKFSLITISKLCLLTAVLLSSCLSNDTGERALSYHLQFLYIYTCKYAVKITPHFLQLHALTSSADSVCPGDTVMFPCVTDTGRLLWIVNNSVWHVTPLTKSK